jgi:hypothetical protein
VRTKLRPILRQELPAFAMTVLTTVVQARKMPAVDIKASTRDINLPLIQKKAVPRLLKSHRYDSRMMPVENISNI